MDNYNQAKARLELGARRPGIVKLNERRFTVITPSKGDCRQRRLFRHSSRVWARKYTTDRAISKSVVIRPPYVVFLTAMFGLTSGNIDRRALISRARSGRGAIELTRWHSCLSPCRTPAVAQTRAQGIRRRRAVARVPFLGWLAVRADATQAIHRISTSILSPERGDIFWLLRCKCGMLNPLRIAVNVSLQRAELRLPLRCE